MRQPLDTYIMIYILILIRSHKSTQHPCLLDYGRKLEYPEKIHTGPGPTCKLHAGKAPANMETTPYIVKKQLLQIPDIPVGASPETAHSMLFYILSKKFQISISNNTVWVHRRLEPISTDNEHKESCMTSSTLSLNLSNLVAYIWIAGLRQNPCRYRKKTDALPAKQVQVQKILAS